MREIHTHQRSKIEVEMDVYGVYEYKNQICKYEMNGKMNKAINYTRLKSCSPNKGLPAPYLTGIVLILCLKNKR